MQPGAGKLTDCVFLLRQKLTLWTMIQVEGHILKRTFIATKSLVVTKNQFLT